eukprot:TRINITY_DN5573_c0_g1_i1.p1 TRINITY_DN5573_c0_g1~~TRINITY_DN5573_c0_g1_i1.p1  ORF type:complete len:209 (-),score=41.31 TRINITY_DN5573_c0_g1_i1:34-660(-)
MWIPVLLCFLLLSTQILAQAPVPTRPEGYVIGEYTAPVRMEVFVDWMCPASAAAWPVIQSVLKHYGPSKVQLTMYVLALPYHRNSFYAAKAGHVVTHMNGDVFKWTDLIFKNQVKWFNGPSRNMTGYQVADDMAKLATQIGLDEKDFIANFFNDDIDWEARVSWKYAVSRGNWGTPLFWLNGVMFPDSGSTLQDWIKIIDPIIGKTDL